MTSATFSTSLEAQQAAALLDGYHFELGSHDARQWVSLWLESYKPGWIRDAIVEALYQGRYKSVSVKQILDLWQRRAKPIRHATHEFESAVCREFGPAKAEPVAIAPDPANAVGQNGSSSTSHFPKGDQHAKVDAMARQSQNGQSSQVQLANQASNDATYRPIPPRKRPPAKPYTGRQAWRNYASGGPYIEPAATKDSPFDERSQNSTAAQNATTGLNAVRTLHRAPANMVSFNLAELSRTVPGMSPPQPAGSEQAPEVANNYSSTNSFEESGLEESRFEESGDSQLLESQSSNSQPLDNSSWREFPKLTTEAYSPAETEETLRLQRQYNGVLYSSARAIQPFKPALPFSAKTLKMAKEKAAAGV